MNGTNHFRFEPGFFWSLPSVMNTDQFYQRKLEIGSTLLCGHIPYGISKFVSFEVACASCPHRTHLASSCFQHKDILLELVIPNVNSHRIQMLHLFSGRLHSCCRQGMHEAFDGRIWLLRLSLSLSLPLSLSLLIPIITRTLQTYRLSPP